MCALILVAIWSWVLWPHTAHAADMPTFNLEMADGQLKPSRIYVPAGQSFTLVIRNTGKGAVEFESIRLHKEKVLAPGVELSLVFRPLDPGEYKFFDDFHSSPVQGVIVAK
jgi:hypothetical protein